MRLRRLSSSSGGEFVEQRRDEGGIDHHHQQLEAAQHDPGIEPPQCAGLFHQRQHHPQQRQADHGAQQGLLDHVAEEQATRHLVEAEACFQPELAVVVEGQVDQPRNEPKPATSAIW
jgi:hypothetical protein